MLKSHNKPLCFLVMGVIALCVIKYAVAAQLPSETTDIMRCLDPLWGCSINSFPRAVGLKDGDYQVVDFSPGVGPKKKVVMINVAVRVSRWSPQELSLAVFSFEFNSDNGLSEVSGFLKGKTADDFETLMQRLIDRYGKYDAASSALSAVTYTWTFAHSHLSVSSNGGKPFMVCIQPVGTQERK